MGTRGGDGRLALHLSGGTGRVRADQPWRLAVAGRARLAGTGRAAPDRSGCGRPADADATGPGSKPAAGGPASAGPRAAGASGRGVEAGVARPPSPYTRETDRPAGRPP